MIDCHACLGTGGEYTYDPYKDKDVWYSCRECDGKGEVYQECGECDGSGVNSDEDDPDDELGWCNYCAGEGYV